MPAVHDDGRGRGVFGRAAAGTFALAAVAAAVVAIVLALGVGDGSELDGLRIAKNARAAATGDRDPFAWSADREDELESQAALGSSHVIYVLSPDGVVASAERTARYRETIERAAEHHGVAADTLEAIIFLESAGRPEVTAGPTPEAASGLAQILPSTATELLDLNVDLERSITLTRKIAKSRTPERAERLRAQRREIDERFDPEAAIDAAARYLAIASERFGDEELAIASYHMGIGNLEGVLRAYADAGDESPIGELVAEKGLTYARVFFGASPAVQADAYELLTGFGDDSSLYLWKVKASEQIMFLYRRDRERLERTADLATAKATLEEVFHPREDTEVFDDPGEIADAISDGELAELPRDPELGWVPEQQMGELAPRLDQEPELYRALRPEALATLSYMAGLVRELSGESAPLRVTSTVRDLDYQELLVGENPQATSEYSLHTTGWSFDIRREYGSKRQAQAFQYVLDRLSATALIDYAVEPGAIHVTVSELGEKLVE